MANQIEHIEIIPVIELEPLSFANEDKIVDSQNLSHDKWTQQNQTYYSHSGLTEIKPIKNGSWLFELSRLSNKELGIIFSTLYEETLRNFESESLQEILNDPIEYAPLIPGGYLLKIDNKTVNEPGCCCGLETIVDWESAAKGQEGVIYTGHDKNLVHIKKEKDFYLLNVQPDSNYKVLRVVFIEAVNKAKSELIGEMKRISNVLNEVLNINSGDQLIQSMIYK